MTTTPRYKPGDRVVALRWPRGGSGVMVKPAPVYQLVRWDGHDEDERVRIDDIRPETAEDVAMRNHRTAMEAWRSVRPETGTARIEYNPQWGRGHEELGAVVRSARTPVEMREAARELQLLANWFEKKPKEES